MNKYNKNAKCVKCGHKDIASAFYAGEGFSHMSVGLGTHCPIKQEHIHRYCKNCQYDWVERPLDAKDSDREPRRPKEKKMEIAIGRIVLYELSEWDAEAINRRRTSTNSIRTRMSLNDGAKTIHWPEGAQAHIGNRVEAGQVYPMIVVRVWAPATVNGQVLLDGSDTFWAESVSEGIGPRTWHWPIINKA